MLNRVDENWCQCTHIYIRNRGTYWGGKDHKTNIYDVLASSDNFKLGEISWFARWRKYVFTPSPDTVYEETCLRDVAEFIVEETKTQKERAKARKTNGATVDPNSVLMLKQLLNTAGGRQKLTVALVPALQRRKRVNIYETVHQVREEIGDDYAFWAEQCLVLAAQLADIAVIGQPLNKIHNTLFALHRA